MLLGTWTIRALGGLTPKGRTDAADTPKRNLADVVAEIVSRFDVCAIQETRGDLTALRTLMRRVGENWGFVVTDVGEGDAANDERLAYLFDRRRVRFSGLVPDGCSRRFRLSVGSLARSVGNDPGGRMHAVIGRVKIKAGHEEETRLMILEGGVSMVRGMAGSAGAYWARTLDAELVQHSFWLFDTEESARNAEATFNRLREMPDAPATFVSVDVCEVIGQA